MADSGRGVFENPFFFFCLVRACAVRGEDHHERNQEGATGDVQEGGVREEDVQEDDRRGTGAVPEGGHHRRTGHG